MKIIEKILFLLIILLLVLPALQKEFRFFNIPELKGDFVSAKKPELSWKEWQSGSFQAKYDEYIKDSSGFKNLLIRLNNQMDYSFYRKIHADGVVNGKKDQLFEYDYIRAYTGVDFIGQTLQERRVRRMKFLQDYLKENFNVDFIFVLEPGKASCYPEYIAEKYIKSSNPNTNYHTIIEYANSYGLNYIDFNRWFPLLKPRADHPLYAQYGTHWSIYGMSFAADSMLNFIEQTRGVKLREVYSDSLILEERSRRPDYDMGAAMNLLFRLPEKEKLAYPVYRFEENPVNKTYPMVLTIGDSYYWNIFNTRIPREVFGNEAFWYFGKKVYPDTYFEPKFVEDLNLKEEIEKQDVIFLMATERFLYKFDWHFIDNAYRLYAPTSEYDKMLDYMSSILTVDEWFVNIIEKAEKQKITVPKMLSIDSKYIYSVQDTMNYRVFYGLSDIEEKILKDENWLNIIKQKAKDQNKPLEQMIKEDALYVFSTDYPHAYEIYMAIQEKKDFILNDSSQMEKTKAEANYYKVSLDEMLQINAEKMIDSSLR